MLRVKATKICPEFQTIRQHIGQATRRNTFRQRYQKKAIKAIFQALYPNKPFPCIAFLAILSDEA